MELNTTIYREGEGLPVVLVHAFPIDHHLWDDCAAELIARADAAGLPNPNFPLWAPDMPGAGEGPIPTAEDTGAVAEDGAYTQALDRMADAYVRLIRDAGYSKAVWVGLSMGGYLVLDIQRLHPEAVAGLALCDTKADADSPASRANRLRIADICETEHTVDPVMHFAEPQPGDSTIKQSQRFIDQFTAWIHAQRPEGVAWRERMAAGRPDLNDQLPLITAPAAVICGENDPSSSPAVMGPIAQAMTGTDAAFTTIPDCGHFSAYEHPDQVAAALLDLIRRAQAEV